MASKLCLQLKSRLHIILAKQNTLKVEIEELQLAGGYKQAKADEVYKMLEQTSDLVLKLKEKLPFNELIKSEKQKLEAFFGMTIEVPSLPSEVTYEKMAMWQEQNFELHYLPDIKMGEKDVFPGWKKKPNDSFYKYIKNGKIDASADQLKAGWILVDATQKPDSRGDVYINDALGEKIAEMRQEGIIRNNSQTATTRFRTNPLRLNTGEAKQGFSEVLGVSLRQIELPRAIEYNVIGQMHHKEWEKSYNFEWFNDKLGNNDYLVSGDNYGNCKFSDIKNMACNEERDNLGFRLFIHF
ncbi:MAG: hypothetical protein WCG01_02285 [bacterium]